MKDENGSDQGFKSWNSQRFLYIELNLKNIVYSIWNYNLDAEAAGRGRWEGEGGGDGDLRSWDGWW